MLWAYKWSRNCLSFRSSPPVFNGVHVTQSLVLCVCFVGRCLLFFLWQLCCLSFFDIRILITPFGILKFFLTPPHFNEVSVPSQESERSCIYVLRLTILYFSTILLLDFRTVHTVWYFCECHFIIACMG
jgi:hypothetical protein